MSTPQIHRALAEAMRVLKVAENDGLPMPSGVDVSTKHEASIHFADRVDAMSAWSQWLGKDVKVAQTGSFELRQFDAVVDGVRIHLTSFVRTVNPAAVA